MYKRKKLIDGIQSFSPGREKWVTVPKEKLPPKVAVNFKTGPSGLLDMKNPRAIHWAKMIDRLKQNNEPIYVEIDEESNIIVNVRVPRIYAVKRLDLDDHGNLLVMLEPSSALHLLLKSDPNFESMQASLQQALDDGSKRLITETRDEHEIIDVRKPEENAGDSSDLPPPPPTDPPVSEARAGEVFDNMNGESCDPSNPSSNCIPFLYPDDGCWIRAHIMCYLMRDGGPDTTTNPPEDPGKVWIDFNPYAYVPTANHPDCKVPWGWHVAPTLDVNTSSGTENWVIDPSVSPIPESKENWRNRQDPTATLSLGPWTDYNWLGDTRNVSLAQAHQNMQYYRDELQDRCLDFGPPPYSCTKKCFFIIDRNTFSDDEIEAMLHISSPALIEDAFYIVVDGFSPYELGFTSATMEKTPNLTISPNISGMTITPDRLEFEYPTHLNRRQRLTWVYNIGFTNISGFTSERIIVTLQASLSTVSSTGYLYLIKQPNPYEIDGETSWLSTDLRVFQIKAGQSKFGVNMGSDPSAFIIQVIENLNNGNTGGQTFENDISVDPQTSRLELSKTVNSVAVYNFAVAKVRYRALSTTAQDVRVFFRLFPVATTSLEYDQATTYRRHEQAGKVVPLLGIKNGKIAAIPCFASPRINSASDSMSNQTDDFNVQDIPPNSNGAVVTQYFGCWLDINQTDLQFPIQPSPSDGPYTSDRKSVKDLIRNEHQCLVSEIAFTPAPAQNGSTPSVSDKLAQRNLALVESANPGVVSSRRIPQTFEIRPSLSKVENDELMIDWGNVPIGSIATVYLPGIDANKVLLLAAKKYRSHRLVRIDEHTLRFEAGGISYIPIPFMEGNLPGLLTVDLPEGIEKGQVFKIVVHQVTGPQGTQDAVTLALRIEGYEPSWRRVVGSFQLTIPVLGKAEILPKQQRLLSNLRWIEQAIPADDSWSPVFGKYVSQVADRVDALGGESSKVGASPSGEWREAYRNCLLMSLVTVLLAAAFVVAVGVIDGFLATASVLVLALLLGTVYLWRNRCRPKMCRVLLALMAGSGVGAIILGLVGLFAGTTPQLVATLIASIVAVIVAIIRSLQMGCFR
jgi:hypothetical protein